MIQAEEVIWALVAIPGLLWWARNRHEAGKDIRALRDRGIENGRMEWAQFSMFLTTVMVSIEFVFILIGVVSMFRRPSPDARTVTQLVLVAGLVGASVALTFLAKRWESVNSTLRGDAIAQAALRRRHQRRGAAQDTREIGQNAREDEQNVRETDQNARDKKTINP